MQKIEETEEEEEEDDVGDRNNNETHFFLFISCFQWNATLQIAQNTIKIIIIIAVH